MKQFSQLIDEKLKINKETKVIDEDDRVTACICEITDIIRFSWNKIEKGVNLIKKWVEDNDLTDFDKDLKASCNTKKLIGTRIYKDLEQKGWFPKKIATDDDDLVKDTHDIFNNQSKTNIKLVWWHPIDATLGKLYISNTILIYYMEYIDVYFAFYTSAGLNN